MAIENHKHFAVVIGNFDGCHLGHKFYIESAWAQAQKMNLELLILTFKPHPVMVLKPQPDYLLSSAEAKAKELGQYKNVKTVEFEFTRDLSNLTGSEFLKQEVLSQNLRAIFWGYDLKIGMDRLSEFNELEKDSAFSHVVFKKLPPLIMNGQKVCSSAIRNFLHTGQIKDANNFLGRKYRLEGNVMRGHGRGAQIGIRTANLDYDKSRLVPGRGVYLTNTIYERNSYLSVTNIGVNPTFGLESLSIETHLLEFDKLIYGEKIEVAFCQKIRDEKKFFSVTELVEQIKRDVQMARDHA